MATSNPVSPDLLTQFLLTLNDKATGTAGAYSITTADVLSAPIWPDIHFRVGEILRAASYVVIYNVRLCENYFDIRLGQGL